MKYPYSITIEKSNYVKSVKNGREFFSVSCSMNYGHSYGSGSPCDNEEEVIEAIEHFLKTVSKEKFKPTLKNIEFTNKTDLNINIGIMLSKGNNLLKFV